TLVDLAVHDYIRIEEPEREQLCGLLHDLDYEIVLLRRSADCGEMNEHERELLEALFDSVDSDAVSSVDKRFHRILPGNTDSTKPSLVADGYYVHNPTLVRTLYLVGAVAAGALVAVIGAGLATRYPASMVTTCVAAVLTGLVIASFGW